MNAQVEPSVYDSVNLDRVRTSVEILVELYMKKLGPDSENLKPRQHIALDRNISSLTKKIMAVDYPVFEEFEFRLFVIAYRTGDLTPELWGKFRRMHPHGDPYQLALASLFHEVMGRPATRVKAQRHGWPFHGDDLESELPLLRQAFDDPSCVKANKVRNRYMEMLETLSEGDLKLHLLAWLGALAAMVEKER